MLIKLHGVAEPVGVRLRANQHEQRSRRYLLAAAVVLDRQRLKMAPAMDPDDL